MTPLAGRATTGPSTTTPTMVSSAPRPGEREHGVAAAQHRGQHDRHADAGQRDADDRPHGETRSCARRDSRGCAASGATRDALTAGATPATSVTTTPTTMPITATEALNDQAAGRQGEPEGVEHRLEQPGDAEAADDADGGRDHADEHASTTTDARIWPRPAPIARSRADSRVRWATMIENVL